MSFAYSGGRVFRLSDLLSLFLSCDLPRKQLNAKVFGPQMPDPMHENETYIRCNIALLVFTTVSNTICSCQH